MKNQPEDNRDWHERRIEDARKNTGGAESPQSRETFPKRTEKPGTAGLANEARPGLGTRATEADPSKRPTTSEEVSGPSKAKKSKEEKTGEKPRATRRGFEKPRPAPREQPPHSLAHEQERDTGVSGHSGGD